MQYDSHSGFPSREATWANSASLTVGLPQPGQVERGDPLNKTFSDPSDFPDSKITCSGQTLTHFLHPLHVPVDTQIAVV